MLGIHATHPSTTRLAANAPSRPNADLVASIVREAARMQHSAAPHNVPWDGSRWTGKVSSQYSSGPRSYVPKDECEPTSGVRLLRTSHDRTVTAAPSPIETQPWLIERIVATTNGVAAAT